MKPADIDAAVSILKEEVSRWKVPVVGIVSGSPRDPFLVLVSCLLSLRTKDAVTEGASRRLFRLARTPRGLASLPEEVIRETIYPVCFYRVKARALKALSKDLLERFGGRVPDGIPDLLTLQGVGRKTANLVVTLGFDKPGICVDTHVHRISNRLGYVRTRTPDETEAALRGKLPRRYWKIWNDLLVAYGQNLCVPVSPWCGKCRLSPHCDRAGVGRSR
jgi:endonuclease-3